MKQSRCTQCGTEGLEPGFIEDAGEHSRGYARWIAGPLERGIFGGAKRMGRQRWQIGPGGARSAGTWSCSPASRPDRDGPGQSWAIAFRMRLSETG